VFSRSRAYSQVPIVQFVISFQYAKTDTVNSEFDDRNEARCLLLDEWEVRLTSTIAAQMIAIADLQ